ncbi:MAG: HAD family hydrolase [Lachnospiraceae bacterium]|nr:HAD family hydrolase [Lachnospiraceae bacterium]
MAIFYDKKKITTVVSDFDGTLLKDGAQDSPEELFPLIEELWKRDVCFIAASGRQYGNIRRLMGPLADRVPYICENGAIAVIDNKIVYKGAFVKEDTFTLIRELEQIPGTERIISGVNTCYTVPKSQKFVDHMRNVVHNDVTVVSDYREIEEDFLKISIFWETGIPADVAAGYHQKYDDKMQIVDGGNGWLDFTPKNISKGHALEILAEKIGFSLTETATFGDSENDISMLQKAGISFCMNTGKEHVKECADYICTDVPELLRGCL